MLAPMAWIAAVVLFLIAIGKEGRRKLNRWAFRGLMLIALVDLARFLTIGSGQPIGLFLLACALAAGTWFLMYRYSVPDRSVEKRVRKRREKLGYLTAAPESQR
jgi:hypothetical protein